MLFKSYQSRRAAIIDVFQVRDFRYFSISNFLSLTAMWIVRICVAWITWEMTRSKVWLGLMAFAELGPSVLISFYAGNLADRSDRFRIIKFGQHFQTVLALLLALLAWRGLASTSWLLVILFAFSIVGGVTQPARMSIAPSLVAGRQLSTAAAIASITLNITRFVGPLICAPLIAKSFESIAFLISALAFGLAAWLLDRIGGVRREHESSSGSLLQNYRPVFATMRKDRVIASVMLLQLAAWLLVRPLTDMLPAFADQVFRAGEVGYSALTAIVGLGALLGALLAMTDESTARPGRFMLATTTAAALAMIVVGLVNSIWLALPLFMAYALFLTASSVVATTCVQLRAPSNQLGRVMSIYSIIVRLAPAVGAVLIGALADVFGLPLVTSLLPLLVIIVAVWFTPSLLDQASHEAKGE